MRGVRGTDRGVSIVLGLILVAAGAVVALWGFGVLHELIDGAPDEIETGPLASVFEQDWWPAVAAVAALLLGVLGLVWLLRHIPRRAAGVVGLPGSGRGMRLRLRLDAVARGAADVLRDDLDVVAAGGRAIEDRGEQLLALDVTLDPRADLAEVAGRIDRVLADAATVASIDGLRSRVIVRVGKRPSASRSRVA